jgi:hypothetical protein
MRVLLELYMSYIFQSRLPSTPDAAIAAPKRTAKQHQKTQQQQLANNQDQIAKALGYLNWSMLQKHIANISWQEIQEFSEILDNHPMLGRSLVATCSTLSDRA